jgi:hypothetical protein
MEEEVGGMKLKDIYRLAVEMGMDKDPRGKEGVRLALSDAGKEYDGLKGQEKKFFDKEKLANPFSDTRILYGDPELDVSTAIAGVDIETPELILVDRLREKGEDIELCLAHHPEGRALAALSDVMALQSDVWAGFGVPINIGDALISERMAEIRRALLPQNHQRPVQTAELLDLPFMCVHTPADNLVTDHLTRLLKRSKPRLVGDVVDLLLEQPEYRKAAELGLGPTVLVGDKKSRAGEPLVDMTGGTEGPVSAIEKLAAAGVGTIVAMHMGENLKKEADKQHVNVIIAGHIASDNIGINLFLDQLQKRGVKSRAFSGLQRVSRIKR